MSELPFNRADVLAVRCPHCGAAPGERCTRPTGQRVEGSYFHNERKAVVYPRFSRGEGGLKRGRVGTTRVFAMMYTDPMGDPCAAVALARNEMSARERLRFRFKEVYETDLDTNTVRIIELDATDGDQLLLIRTDMGNELGERQT